MLKDGDKYNKDISIHALRGEGDQRRKESYTYKTNFYPRPPWGGRPVLESETAAEVKISIHALRGEGDPPTQWISSPTLNFYPRPPRGGRPTARRHNPNNRRYFYPRPPRGGRPFTVLLGHEHYFISIHALRGEGDAMKTRAFTTS